MVSNSYAKKFLLQSIQQQQRYLAKEERSKEQNSGLSSQDLSSKIKKEEETTANEFDDEEIDPPENWQSEYDEQFVEAEQGEDYEEIIPPRRR